MTLAEKTLQDCRILIAEDEYMLADELRTELEDAGAIVVGPVGALADMAALIHNEPHIDGAVLDANLGGELVFPAADLLVARGVPIVFTTGYDASVIPNRFSACPRCEKPLNMRTLTQTISRAVHP